MPFTLTEEQPDLAAAMMSWAEGFVIMLCTGISCTGESPSSSYLLRLNSAIFLMVTSGAWTAYCFQLASPLHGTSVMVTRSRNLQFLAPACPESAEISCSPYFHV